MIDFACRQFEIDEIIKCSLGLTKAEYRIFEHMLKHHVTKISTAELAKSMKLDITTIQKSVKKLYQKGVLERTQKNMDGGGYVFCYRVSHRSDISKTVLSTINSWTKKVEQEMQNWSSNTK